MLSQSDTCNVEATVAADTCGMKRQAVNNDSNSLARGERSKASCFRCRGLHTVRECMEPKPMVVCFRRSHHGHIANNC